MQPKTCSYYLEQKKRKCAYPSIREHCTEHTICDENGCILRTPCPFTNSHTIAVNKYENHLKTCVMRPKYEVYYQENINGSNARPGPKITLVHDANEFQKIEELINQLYQKISVIKIDSDIRHHPILAEKIVKSEIGKPMYKKSMQHSSLLGQLDAIQGLRNDVNFVEFGSGAGEMSRFVTLVVGKPRMTLLVDRKKIKLRLNQDFKANPYQRIISDIKDLNLTKVPGLGDAKAVVYSKHLCGSATDLSIRCLENYMKDGGKVHGLVIALCCHQLCTFENYINRKYLNDLQICRRDFAHLALVSTYAVCGEAEGSAANHWSGIPYDKREELGFKCKRILDVGRLLYLQNLGADARLVKYVDLSVTKENCAIIATWENTEYEV